MFNLFILLWKQYMFMEKNTQTHLLQQQIQLLILSTLPASTNVPLLQSVQGWELLRCEMQLPRIFFPKFQ